MCKGNTPLENLFGESIKVMINSSTPFENLFRKIIILLS